MVAKVVHNVLQDVPVGLRRGAGRCESGGDLQGKVASWGCESGLWLLRATLHHAAPCRTTATPQPQPQHCHSHSTATRTPHSVTANAQGSSARARHHRNVTIDSPALAPQQCRWECRWHPHPPTMPFTHVRDVTTHGQQEESFATRTRPTCRPTHKSSGGTHPICIPTSPHNVQVAIQGADLQRLALGGDACDLPAESTSVCELSLETPGDKV